MEAESIKYINRLIELIEIGDNINIKQRLLHLRSIIEAAQYRKADVSGEQLNKDVQSFLNNLPYSRSEIAIKLTEILNSK